MGWDMFNKIFKNLAKVAVVLTGCLMLASFSPSLDGRAVVVDEGVFPSGIFAKTVGYLPGDIISVTNITGDATIDILVIGALDPSEGVAIMLSPEAATAIGIDPEANNIVKITKRSNQDERVYGTAIIARQDSNTPFPSNMPVTESTEETATESVAGKVDENSVVPAEEVTEETLEAVTPSEEYSDEYVDDDLEEDVIPEETEADEDTIAETDSVEESEVEEKPASYEEYKEEYEPLEDEAPAEEYSEDYNPEEDVIDEEYVEEEVAPAPAEGVIYEEETVEPVAEEKEDVIEAEPFQEEELEEDIPEEDAVEEEVIEEDVVEEDEEETAEPEDEISEEFVEEETESEATETPAEETASEEVPVEEEFVEEEVTEEPAEEETVEDEVTEDEVAEDEVYDEIVLVPAEENVPEVEEPVKADASVENEPIILDEPTILDEPVAVEEEVVPVEEVKPQVTAPATSYSAYVVNDMSDLEKGKYYIQIGVLKSEANILEIINKYSKKYPIVVVPAGNGTNKVMVGPLSMDEYGTVLERFKSYGYKDAFVRKIK